MTVVERKSVQGRYLQYIISRNRYLQLQGILSGDKLVHIELRSHLHHPEGDTSSLVGARKRMVR